ncbi:MAG: threonine ammonia-lyase [Deltaproteobacteria bacterium]|nr:threonine ammonia-lyase [Deltaproteobacteria bacterium]
MLNLNQIIQAQERIASRVILTPLRPAYCISRLLGANIHCKLENLQRTGSFKVRGALNKFSQIVGTISKLGVVAASAGNHAQGVALAAREFGFPATVVMPRGTPISKQEATAGYGAQVILHGTSVTEALERARELAQEGRVFIHPFDDEEIIAGQGTIGLEILRQFPDVAAVFVPVGGGGLIAGIASAIKERAPQVKIIGVESEAAAKGAASIRSGRNISALVAQSLADGIMVRQLGELTFPIIMKYVDDIVAVSDDDVAHAMLMLLENLHVVAEGAGAAPLAAIIRGHSAAFENRPIVLLVSGGNVDVNILGRIIQRGLVSSGRILRLSLTLRDIPGTMAKVLNIIAASEANVLQIHHDRMVTDLSLYETRVELDIETRGSGHDKLIQRRLKEAGYGFKKIR